MAINLDDYIEVHERIAAFYAKHPDGSIQSEVIELTDSRVTVKAWAYRSADDGRPGIGHSFMSIPGSTPYTRGSEIENAETSAWGRAIAALGCEVKRGVATAEEVRSKQNGSAPVCPIHNVPLKQSPKTKKWGHTLEDGSGCVPEEATASAQ